MALNLKRKRAADASPRKTRKVSEEPDVVSSNEEMESGGEEFEEEEEEWGGVEGGDDEVKPREPLDTSSKPKKPPTAEEMRAIREATDLYRSSSFKLQIDALLPNVRPKASRIPPLEKFLLNLHTFLLKIPSVSAQHPLEASKGLLKKGIAVPYCLPLPTEETNWKVAFEKPSEITLVGSWANKVSVKPKDDLHYGVDVAVEMPASLFQEKDYLNARFFQKKAFYLATIAQAIQNPKSGLNVDLFYESSSSDPRLTKLVLIPKSDGSQTDFTKLKARVCIIPTLPAQSPIPLHRLSPSHGNLKINTSQQSESPSQPQPTPVYNNALLYSLTPKPHLLATYNLIQSSPAFSDALTLLRIWANQRGFGQGSRMCVKGFEDAGPFWIGLLELLITGEETKNSKRKPLGKGLSSYQLFKAALDCLSKQEFSKAPVFVKTVEGQRYQSDEYQDYWHASLVDSASLVNLLASIPVGCLDLLRYEASKTLEALNSSTLAIDPFTQVFLQDHRDVHTRFDVVLRVDITGAKQRQPSVHASLDRGSTFHQLLFNMDSLLRQALGPRAKAISFLCPSTTPSSPSTRPLSQAHPSTPTTAFIGLILDPEHAFQLVQHGPAAEDQVTPELTAFRELWGPKSELRRFKDGRITESVVWDVKTADERAHIPAMVVKHILDWHFGISQEKVESWQTAYDNLIRLPKEVSGRYVEGLKGTAIGFKGALGAFEGLVKAIKALEEELPLSLVNASAISSSLRYTSVFNPVPLTPGLASSLPPTARYLHPIDIIFEFEKSGKWPDELKAIQKIKLAFFERMAVLLMGSVPGLKASVVLGEGDVTDSNEVVDKAYLEILTPEGWAFRGRIWHDREATLLDRILDERGPLAHIAVPKSKKKEERKGKVYLDAQVAREVYERRFVHAPRHHRAVAALSHRYGAFAGTCRLVKRWFGAHWLLGGHGSEGIGAPLSSSRISVFFVGDGKMVGVESDAGVPVPSSVPATKERGFATVLRFLSEWKWEEGGVWVCLYGPRGSEEEESSGAGTTGAVNGASTTGTVPGAGATGATATSGGVWKFNTDMDKEGRMWTKYGPDAIVAKRIRALAVATVRFMQGVEGSGFDVRGMFIHPTEDYDFIVHLDPSVLPRYMHNVNPDPKLLTRQGKYANQVGEKVESVMPGFDPARALFVDLQRTYADTFRLFFDPYGGTQFGGVWDPTLKTARPFRVLGGFNSQPVPKESEKEKDKGLVTLNEGAVLAEVRRMGQGLVKDITRRA
ncbi:pre-rRNA processing protein Utp22 [Coprinopsis cinerea okayama7|uniref:U3 small nucleolar RNA-associated protein 22 n=1 Tax=Coprinopsis cinerea (strain Okayama-7 / 130 / ATCC MYA-4618 / FGSC 9003) TaxID=240176 RepID=A8NLX3_COPC7|nr:pre-rRNA processing protein Utp22 [Coprinopsis cinerea okayama7\|eukprot:XP_001834793.1 pre-rRNA processing protein Utp22 [Coprinopsis cinerea okayama7\